MKISILIPTKGRPTNMKSVVSSIMETAYDNRNVEVIFYIDDNDTISLDWAEYLRAATMEKVNYVVGPKIIMSSMWNECYKISDADIFMYCGDDVVFRTPGWDQIVERAFEEYDDRIALVYGRDGVHNEVLATHGFVHRNWVEAVGYVLPPYFVSDHVDQWLTDVARKLGRNKYLDNVLFEHMHFSVGKSEKDDTYKDRLKIASEKEGHGDLYKKLEINRTIDFIKLAAAIKKFKDASVHNNVQPADLAG